MKKVFENLFPFILAVVFVGIGLWLFQDKDNLLWAVLFFGIGLFLVIFPIINIFIRKNNGKEINPAELQDKFANSKVVSAVYSPEGMKTRFLIRLVFNAILLPVFFGIALYVVIQQFPLDMMEGDAQLMTYGIYGIVIFVFIIAIIGRVVIPFIRYKRGDLYQYESTFDRRNR